MKIGDLFYETWHALSANKGRSLLTILGIVIGIAAVIAMTSLIAGIQNTLMGEMGFEQARQVSISAYSPDGVTFDDLDKLERGMPEYEALTGAAYASAEITGADGQPVYMGITGVRPDYFGVMGSKLKEGRFFTDAENEGAARLVVVDASSLMQLFGSADAQPVGSSVRLGNDDYTVVGVLESASFMGGSSLYVPSTTAQTRLGGRAASSRSSASRARAPIWTGWWRRRRRTWRSTSTSTRRASTCSRSMPSSSRWRR